MGSTRTTIPLDEQTRNRLRSAKLGDGETYSECINRILDAAIGYQGGEKVTAENVMSTPVRVDDTWLEPGETGEFWSESNALVGAIERGHVERVDQ